jgi:hypothetical protein
MAILIGCVTAVSATLTAFFLCRQYMFSRELYIEAEIRDALYKNEVLVLSLNLFPGEHATRIDRITVKNALLCDCNEDVHLELPASASNKLDVSLIVPPSRNSSGPEFFWAFLKPLNPEVFSRLSSKPPNLKDISSLSIALETRMRRLPITYKINTNINWET